MESWLPGVAADTAIGEANNTTDNSPDAKAGGSASVCPKAFSQQLRRSTLSRCVKRKRRSRDLRTKDRSSIHNKWTNQLEALLKFKKAAAVIGGAPTEMIAWALPSNTTTKDLKMACAPEAAQFSPETTIQHYTTTTLMKQMYQDIHTRSVPGLINSTSDLAYFLGREPCFSTQNKTDWIQLNLALETQAMFKVIEYAVAGSESAHRSSFTTANAAVSQLRIQPDTVCRTSDVVANKVHLLERYASFAAKHGWMMLSILANSAAFREAARTFDDLLWISFNASICHNKSSVELFAKIRGLNWILALTRTPFLASYITDLGEGYPGIEPDHPHNYIVPQNSEPIRQPQYRGKIQTNIINNRFKASDFGLFGRSKNPPRDPTIQNGLQCQICGCTLCHCEPSSCKGVLRPLVELVQSGNKLGVGVRVLQPIRSRQLLAEYVGEILPDYCDDDDTYAIAITPHDGAPSTATISAQKYGNWTRFVNHSCNPHAVFVNRVIGNRHRIMLFSIKDIEMFEELTVDYGDNYWATRPILCKCGSHNCRFATVEKRNEMELLMRDSTQ
ncbi:hypothetical protein MMC29_005162 [Sticta canariensis]|nr:hypothetical protein [Sticta canariensis]